MTRSSRIGNGAARRHRAAIIPVPTLAELREAVKTAGANARNTRKQAKDAAMELKRLKSTLEKARKAASRQKALERAGRSAGKSPGKSASAAKKPPRKAANSAPARRGRPPKAARAVADTPVTVAA